MTPIPSIYRTARSRLSPNQTPKTNKPSTRWATRAPVSKPTAMSVLSSSRTDLSCPAITVESSITSSQMWLTRTSSLPSQRWEAQCSTRSPYRSTPTLSRVRARNSTSLLWRRPSTLRRTTYGLIKARRSTIAVSLVETSQLTSKQRTNRMCMSSTTNSSLLRTSSPSRSPSWPNILKSKKVLKI